MQLRGVLKAGDVFIPGDDALPRFSATPFIHEIDRVLDHMTAADLGGFRALMTLFALMPRVLLAGLLRLTERADVMPRFLAAPLRMINIGVKGVVMSLYYSDLTEDGRIHRVIGWDAQCGEPELAPDAPAAKAAFVLARRGAQTLRKMSVRERLACVRRLKDAILRRQEWIIDEIQAATGKSRSDALISEVFSTLDHLAYLEKFATKVLADRKVHTPLVLMGKRSRIYFEPLGTVLVISPWNYPFYQAVVPSTAALVCGDAVVYKPSEYTPMRGVIEALREEAGISAAWWQVVYGDGAVGSELIEQRPDKIFFTGSTRTGKKIMEQAARHLIPVELELGGKDPMIVFADANVERAAAGAAWGAFTNTGQSCTSVERLYVHESIYERFKEALLREARRIKQEVDRDGDADIGAMTNDMQVAVVARHVEDAKAKGARFLTGEAWDGAARLIPPMVVEGVTPSMLVYREETFGPLLPILTFRTEEEAVRLANDSEFGLSASVWTRDLQRAERVARAIVTGNVSINNVMLSEGNHALPFGGTKQSGFGRYKGELGLYSFCNVKSVIVDKDSAKIEVNWYPYTRKKYQLFGEMTRAAFGRGLGALVRFVLAGLKLEGYAGKASREGRDGG